MLSGPSTQRELSYHGKRVLILVLMEYALWHLPEHNGVKHQDRS